MKTKLLAGAAALATVSLISAGAASAGTISINFDGLQNGELVNTYYDGGSGSLGSTGGPNYGVSFANAEVLDENLNNEQLLITPPNSITFLSGGGAIMDVAAGFTTGFSFDYSSPFDAGVVTVWSGLDGTGTQLASLSLPLTADGINNPACSSKDYCPDVPFGVTFSGTAESVNFSGTANYIVYDDITLGSSTPGVPEPATWAMMLVGFGGLGAAMRSARRKQAALAA
jgi:hypothetical protein